MTHQINSKYLENYASSYASEVCNRFFQGRKFIGGQEIISLTTSTQVNFFILKKLFGLWQEELEVLKSNPFFDYRDIAVHEALTQFMNVLSKRIKVERSHFEPLLQHAVVEAVQVATDPVGYYQQEIRSAEAGQINEYLKENKKYYKWHAPVVNFLVDKTGFGLEKEPYLKALAANHEAIKGELESVNLLIATLGDVLPFDLDRYQPATEDSPSPTVSRGEDSSFFDQIEKETPASETPTQAEPQTEPEIKSEPEQSPAPVAASSVSAEMLRRKFETESYVGMKSVVGNLSEGLAINQRFMFTRELFDGNSDLLMHALKQIDASGDFSSAVRLIQDRYASELSWEMESEPVQEFLQLVYRRFDD